jgi:hypothetical protein
VGGAGRTGRGGTAVSFVRLQLPAGARTKQEALALAYESGVVCTDEVLLHPDPHASRDAWCEARVTATERRLAELGPGCQWFW